MCGQDAFRDGEAQAGASQGEGRLRVGLVELLEDVRDLVAGNAGAGVTHGHTYVVTLASHDQRHAASLVRELEGVRKQVPKHLVHPNRVPQHLVRNVAVALDLETHLALKREYAERALEISEELREHDRSWFELATAGVEAAHIEQLPDESR